MSKATKRFVCINEPSASPSHPQQTLYNTKSSQLIIPLLSLFGTCIPLLASQKPFHASTFGPLPKRARAPIMLPGHGYTRADARELVWACGARLIEGGKRRVRSLGLHVRWRQILRSPAKIHRGYEDEDEDGGIQAKYKLVR
ncbi:hypothetical protein GLAREA_01348 [Glarea lozoyensis ATCC 20868]|uniref:Uncharacterized protein n=1 Tax=Glarea lozoyensis (strain ATCC 20868 / MF5171) TaxID=1116229 RepID=S3D047_GLAL2|nr:uncharacterized protein GLAREA_01348 [Glarea lozoyensis ATCC 20868]EPE25436.1 hypothetical protein GLAREA_01348 [Glarea lozoyensis ATCC 20868]